MGKIKSGYVLRWHGINDEPNTILALLLRAIETTATAYDLALGVVEEPSSDSLTNQLEAIRSDLETIGLIIGVNFLEDQQ